MYHSNLSGFPAKPIKVLRLAIRRNRCLLSRSLKLRPAPKANVGASIVPLRILIVDDDPLIGELLVTILQSLNYAPTFCSAPLAVLDHLAREVFDVVLTDYHMPEMTGIDLAHQLRLRTPVPVILMTGVAKDEVVAKMDCSDLALILQKPFDVASVVHAITNATKI